MLIHGPPVRPHAAGAPATMGVFVEWTIRGTAALSSLPSYARESRIEIGPWFEAGTRLDPADVHRHLLKRNHSSRRRHPYCIYVHVPFCPTRCTYCALYTMVPRGEVKEALNEYLKVILRSIRAHPAAHPARAPTTVHFGGGTPLFLGMDRFAAVVSALRRAFGSARKSEWALETSTSSMDPETAGILRQQGFHRLHLGIQTLDERLRRRIRRRESGKAALEKIHMLRECGFRVSADLILGLEGQTGRLLVNDLEQLFASGVRMFSVCELRNLSHAIRTQETAAWNYGLWCDLWEFMTAHGLHPIHLGQFGQTPADNLYYTHPARGEDCISIGPYAHGSDGPVMYANQLLPAYYESVRANRTPVRFGVLYDRDTLVLRKLERELLGHRVRIRSMEAVLGLLTKRFERLWHSWLESGLLEFSGKAKCFRPTRDGSWYVGNMITDLRSLAAFSKRALQ